MNRQAAALHKQTDVADAAHRLLQRKCECGAHTPGGGTCRNCTGEQRGLQRKLSIGASDDPFEREADRVADRALAMQASDIGRAPLPIQRLAPSAPAHSAVPDSVDQALRGSGVAIDRATREDMEQRFGHDFSQVRVHQDGIAAQSARDVGAQAYTVGRDIVFGAGMYAPHCVSGRRLLAHELAHTVQQTGGGHGAPARPPALQRKVVLKGTEIDLKSRNAFLTARKWKNTSLARMVMEDMASAADTFDFASDAELETEITKRISTVAHQRESQEAIQTAPGQHAAAFGYPFNGESALYGPRVNFKAHEYWTPDVPDNYDVRTDKVKNAALKALPRHSRCTVYGDQCGLYRWKLSAQGKHDPYKALSYLFAPQAPHKRTLFHCDYLISAVNFLSFADSLGAAEFNKRVIAYGADNMVLTWNAFSDLNLATWKRDPAGDMIADPTTRAVVPGLGSMQNVVPSSEADLVLGDHVIFWNHLAYDTLNANIGNAWRLENAILVSKSKGQDIFVGHGSGYKTVNMMHGKLAEEFNDVANIALKIAKSATSTDATVKKKAEDEMALRFPKVKRVGDEWRVQGTDFCGRPIDMKLRTIKAAEVTGLKNPCDVTKMNSVNRPIESAK